MMHEMPKPTAEHKKLELLAGNWTGEEKIAPSPWDAAGGTAIGRVCNKVSLDGFNVIQEYEQERGGKTSFRGHGVFGYDANAKCYVLHWWDSMGMGVNEFRGQFTGDVLSMTFAGVHGHNRCTFDVSKPGGYAFTMDVSQDGKIWMNFMQGGYSKKG